MIFPWFDCITVPFNQFLGNQALIVSYIQFTARPQLHDASDCSIRSIIILILYCNVISFVDKKVTVSQMVSRGKWAQYGKNCSGQFCPLDVFVAGCCCPLHETAASLVTMACGWWHDWLWRGISAPSMKSWSLAWDLAPQGLGWQQYRSSLALAPLFSGGPLGDRGLVS